ncbi:MAG: pyrroline-5-carboxylate reductase [Cyanobacteria bacterium NC_groundwater_1444_Ag_S-0.65um_54_12]|nr:pyrroline-5-carboxylate reductase [Cyanobacteria bacterium NC_groundwater_1444_Ag_S-0.65um_54_12]
MKLIARRYRFMSASSLSYAMPGAWSSSPHGLGAPSLWHAMLKTMSNPAFSLIGGGTMAEALVKGLIGHNVYLPAEILVSDPLTARRDYLAAAYSVRTTPHNRDCLAAGTVLFAVKPAQLPEVLAEVGPAWPAGSLAISIVAGAKMASFCQYFPNGEPPLVRTMPNTCCTVGMGITAIACNEQVEDFQRERAQRIFESVGEVIDLAEHYFDAVTGLSGSGPAYITLIIEALVEAGVQQGLPRRISRELVCQTVAGAALLVKSSGKHPAELKDQVVTPAGTTASGLQVLEEAAVRATLCLAVKAATLRSRELGQETKR